MFSLGYNNTLSRSWFTVDFLICLFLRDGGQTREDKMAGALSPSSGGERVVFSSCFLFKQPQAPTCVPSVSESSSQILLEIVMCYIGRSAGFFRSLDLASDHERDRSPLGGRSIVSVTINHSFTARQQQRLHACSSVFHRSEECLNQCTAALSFILDRIACNPPSDLYSPRSQGVIPPPSPVQKPSTHVANRRQ